MIDTRIATVQGRRSATARRDEDSIEPGLGEAVPRSGGAPTGARLTRPEQGDAPSREVAEIGRGRSVADPRHLVVGQAVRRGVRKQGLIGEQGAHRNLAFWLIGLRTVWAATEAVRAPERTLQDGSIHFRERRRARERQPGTGRSWCARRRAPDVRSTSLPGRVQRDFDRQPSAEVPAGNASRRRARHAPCCDPPARIDRSSDGAIPTSRRRLAAVRWPSSKLGDFTCGRCAIGREAETRNPPRMSICPPRVDVCASRDRLR